MAGSNEYVQFVSRVGELDLSLGQEAWYWGELNRADVNTILQDHPDGSFLVRDASTPGDYTLTVKIAGLNKLIKIYHQDGYYRLQDTDHFRSVRELVEYYMNNSLASYNKKLDTKLIYPIPCTKRNSNSSGEDEKMLFKQLRALIKEREDDLRFLIEQNDEVQKSLAETSQLAEALDQTLRVYGDQIKLQETFHTDVEAMEIQSLNQNYNKLRRRYNEIERNMKLAEVSVGQYTQQKRQMLVEIGEIKSDINKITRQLEEVKDFLVSKKILPHLVERTWRVVCERKDATEYLRATPEGTFLLREKTENDKESYAISISYNNEVVHVRIHHTDSGYGIANGFCTHVTLLDLVLHYEAVSLAEHNPAVDVTLRYPFKTNEAFLFYDLEPIYSC